MKVWSNEEEKLLIEKLKDGLKYTEISILFNRTTNSIKEKSKYLKYRSIIIRAGSKKVKKSDGTTGRWLSGL